MAVGCHFLYPTNRFPAPAGQGLLTSSRINDFSSRHSFPATADEFIDRPAGRAWPSNDDSRGRLYCMTTFLYCRRRVKPAGTQKNDQPSTLNRTNETPHPYDLVIGLDRSDKKADLHLVTTATGQRRSQTIDTAFHISGLLGGRFRSSLYQINGNQNLPNAQHGNDDDPATHPFRQRRATRDVR